MQVVELRDGCRCEMDVRFDLGELVDRSISFRLEQGELLVDEGPRFPVCELGVEVGEAQRDYRLLVWQPVASSRINIGQRQWATPNLSCPI